MNAIPSDSDANNQAVPSTDPVPDKPRSYSSRRASERIFRRSRAARARRAKADKSDFRFISLILQLSVLLALGLVGLGVLAQKQVSEAAMSGRAPSVNLAAMQDIAMPWLGPLSKLEVGGIVLIMLVSLTLLWRWRRR